MCVTVKSVVTEETQAACYCWGDGEFTHVYCGHGTLHKTGDAGCSYEKVEEVYFWPWEEEKFDF
jgi:Cys-tRNA synthase (O-phospho-L-seryl-tRNA:Cys-tRNA synthase)